MIITVNSVTQAYIVWAADIRSDVVESISWLAEGRNSPPYYFTDKVEGYTRLRILPVRLPDIFLTDILKSHMYDGDNISQSWIDEYVNFWKNRGPIKEFFAK